jgi:hypothetical protein
VKHAPLVILLLVAPTLLLIIGVAIHAVATRYYRRRCPACLQRGLKSVSVVRTFTETSAGERSPEYWSYHICEKCGQRFKLHNGMLTGVPEDELSEATRFG